MWTEFLLFTGEKRNGYSSNNGNIPAALLPVEFPWIEERIFGSAQWAIVIGLRYIRKDDPETHHNFDPPRRGWLSCLGTSIGMIWMGTLRTLHPRKFYMHLASLAFMAVFNQANFPDIPVRRWLLEIYVFLLIYLLPIIHF